MGYGVKTTPGSATAMNLINILQEILLEAGWSKTADTGQWGGDTDFGSTDEYVMWAMPTTGGLDPVLLKIQPANINSKTRAHINLTIGKTSDGSGTLTGTTWPGGTTHITAPYGGAAQTVYYAYDNGGVVICSNPPTGFTQLFVLIERKRTPSGAPTNGALGTMFYRGSTHNNVLPDTTDDVSVGLRGVSVFNTNSFAKTWGTKNVSSPIADSTDYPKSTDGLTAPTQPVMFFGPDGGWYSNLVLVVQPSEGGTSIQAVVNGSPRYYRTVQPNVATIVGSSSNNSNSYPISGNTSTSYTINRNMIVPAILNQ